MQIITSSGFYFFGTTKELRHFLAHLCNHYTTVTQLLKQKRKKRLGLYQVIRRR